MANQMIALQARNPQLPDPARQNAQYASMMNMAAQQRTSQRQAEQAQQTMDINAAREARDVAMQEPNLREAGFKADAAQIKMLTDFSKLSINALQQSQSPEDAVIQGNRLKAQFTDPHLQDSIDQTVAKLTADPANFEPMRQQLLYQSMEADKQLEQEITEQNLGSSTRMIRTPKYGGGPAEVVKGSQADITLKPTGMNVEGLGAGAYDPNTNTFTPATVNAVGTQPVVGGPRSTPGTGNTADVVYGFGKFGSPSKPLSTLTLGEVQDFQRNTLIPNTRGKVGAGPDKGTGAVGTYQITYETLNDYAPKVLGSNWRNTPFTPDVQEKVAKAIYEDVKGGDLKKTWAGLPSNRPGAYANVPWEQVRDQIIQVESGGGPRRGGGTPTTTQGGAPQTTQQAVSAADKARTVKDFKDITGFDFTSGKDPVAALIKSSTSGGAEKIGADIVGFIPESMGGGSTKGMEAIGALEVIGSDLLLALIPGNKLNAGVSNEDRKVFEKLVGQMQNPNVPAGMRLAAWGQLKEKMARISGVPIPKTPTGGSSGGRKTLTKKPSLTDIFAR